MKTTTFLVSLATGLLVGCGTVTDDGGSRETGSCPNIAGTYRTTEHCDSSKVGDPFTVTQSGCSIDAMGFSGTVSRDGSLSLAGQEDGMLWACSGAASATSFSTRCTAAGQHACNVSGMLATGSGGGGGGGGGGGATGQVDDPCTSASTCALQDASCEDLGDGVTRCEARCTTDAACGTRGACLFSPGQEMGMCWRLCNTASDCASGNWSCQQIVSGSSQGYCVPAWGNP
jgi:hypothetical protein